jgi:hypothetical protein
VDTNGNLGGIYTSTDSGVNWTQTLAPTNNWWSVASSVDGCKLVAVAQMSGFFPGNGGNIYTSTNSGLTWLSNNVPIASWSSVVSSADGSKLVAICSYPTNNVITSTNSGATWINTSPSNLSFNSIASSADGNKIVAATGYASQIYISQSIPTPALGIAPSSANLTLSWIIPSCNFALQQNSDLTTTNWINVATAPVLNLTNLQNQTTLPSPEGSYFYRLKSQ